MASQSYPMIPTKQSRMNNAVDQVGVGAASAFGPWWGLLAQGGVEGSKRISGDGTSNSRNVMGTMADPFNQFKNNNSGEDWAKSFLTPAIGSFTKGRRMKKQAEAAKQAEQKEFAKFNTARSNAFYNSEMRRLGSGDSAFSLSSIQ